MPGYAQLLDGPPLMWRWALEAPLFLREARTAREPFELAITAARERGIAGALPSADPPARARCGHDRPLAGGARRATTRRPSSRTTPASRGGVRGALAGLPGSRRARGSRSAAARTPSEALALAREYGRGLYEAWALAALGDLELALGRPAEAVERLADMSTALDRLGIARRRPLARARARRGARAVRARRRGGRGRRAYRERAAAKGQPWAQARAARAEGLSRPTSASPPRSISRCPPRRDARHVRARAHRARLRRAPAARAPAGEAREHLRAALAAFARSAPSPGPSARGSSSPRPARRRASAIRARSTSSRRASFRSRSTSRPG